MTKRMLVVALVISACVAGFPSRAAAKGLDDIWDIIDHLSGPGPFTGGPVIAATIPCRQGREWKVMQAVSNPSRKDPCIYVEFRDLHVDPKGPFERVSAKLVETGVTFQQHPALDIGAGFGVAYFATTVNRTDYNVTNFVVTPVRVVVKPLRLLFDESTHRRAASALSSDGEIRRHRRVRFRCSREHVPGRDGSASRRGGHSRRLADD